MRDPAVDKKRKCKRKLRVVRPSPSSGEGLHVIDNTVDSSETAETDTSSQNEKDNKKLLELRADWIKKLTTEGEMTEVDFSLEATSSGSDGSVQDLVRKGSPSRKASEALVELLQRDNSPLDELPEELRSGYRKMISDIHSLLDRHREELKRMFEYHLRKILVEANKEPRKTTEENEKDEEDSHCGPGIGR